MARHVRQLVECSQRLWASYGRSKRSSAAWRNGAKRDVVLCLLTCCHRFHSNNCTQPCETYQNTLRIANLCFVRLCCAPSIVNLLNPPPWRASLNDQICNSRMVIQRIACMQQRRVRGACSEFFRISCAAWESRTHIGPGLRQVDCNERPKKETKSEKQQQTLAKRNVYSVTYL